MFTTVVDGREPVTFKTMDELAEFFLEDSRRLMLAEPTVWYGHQGARVLVTKRNGHDPRDLTPEEFLLLTHTVATRATETPPARAKLMQSTEMVKAMSHPTRARIFRYFERLPGGEDQSPRGLADLFDQPLGNISYHVRTLCELGFIKISRKVPRRGAIEHYYVYRSKPAGVRPAEGKRQAKGKRQVEAER